MYEVPCEPVGNPRIHNQTNWVGPFCRWESKVKIWFADGLVLWQFRFDTQGMIQMSETGTYVRYTQELFTNKFAMQAMMQNNQDVASENIELYILNMA